MRIVLELSPEKAQQTTEKVAQGTAIVVSGLFSLAMSTVATAAAVGSQTYKELKKIK